MVRSEREIWRGCGLALPVYRHHDPSAPPSGLTALLLHGFMDAGGTWDELAAPLAEAGVTVLAPDLRGFGGADRVGAGGYYHFPDYVADVDMLVEQLPEGTRLVVTGHSMGGTVACLYAGARPERVERLVLLEGVGPPGVPADAGLHRLRRWLEQLREGPRASAPRSREDALRRLALVHARVDPAVLERKLAHLLVEEPDGSLRWAYDPLHRTMAPYRFDAEVFAHVLKAITCPTLFIGGGADGFHPEDEAVRLSRIAGPVTRLDFEDAGHMLHWTRPREVAAAWLDFVASSPA